MRPYKAKAKDQHLLAWSRWGVAISWTKEELIFVKPDKFQVSQLIEDSYEKLLEFVHACPNTESLEPEQVILDFFKHFMNPTPDDPEPKVQRYGRKGFTQGYQIYFIRSFCNHLVEHYNLDGSQRKSGSRS
jgi:hypothetical protein